MATLTLTRLERELKSQVVPYRSARVALADWRIRNDGMRRALLTPPDGNAKLHKGSVPSYSLNLAPANSSGRNVCPRSTAGCRATCLVTAGRFAMGSAPEMARQRRTKFMIEDFASFLALLDHEIRVAKAKHGKIAVRLNGLSDLRWELIAMDAFGNTLFDTHHDVQFYDYSAFSPDERRPPVNYDLTYLIKERHTDADIRKLALRHRIAMVVTADSAWRKPGAFNGLTPIVDGDTNDMRWLNPSPAVVILKPKGKARNTAATRGFVRA